jgi:hypothetical protein
VLAVAAGTALATAPAVTSGALAGRHGSAGRDGPSAQFLAAARAGLVRYLHDSHPQAELVGPAAPAGPGIGDAPQATAITLAYNWSGYAGASAAKGKFTEVGGSWVTPAVMCTAADSITSEWVGLDGFNSPTVEQDGTLGWCFEGKATYFTWYEMYPAGTVNVGSSLQPGDRITASVARAGTTYTLSVTDATHPADSFSNTLTCAATTCRDTSVEWVAERPAFSIGVAPLANYGTWTLTGGTVSTGGRPGPVSSLGYVRQIMMVDATNTYPLSTASALAANGTAFSATWRNSY